MNADQDPRPHDVRSAPSSDLSPTSVEPTSMASAGSHRDQSMLHFEGLEAPRPISAAPPTPARWLAFVGILIGGLLGGLIGYGVADLLSEGAVWPAIGGLTGALIGATGVGIVSALTLRAMGEWKAVRHPEADRAEPTSSPPHRDQP